MSHNVRDWIETRREYLRQLAELEARLNAKEHAMSDNHTPKYDAIDRCKVCGKHVDDHAIDAARAAANARQVQQLAEQGNVTQ